MRSYIILSIAALAAAAAPPVSINAGPAPAGPVTQTITVGGLQANPTGPPTPNLVFSPNSVVAKPGDVIRFMIMGPQHNVVQTTFDQPCTPMPNGFTSGMQSNPSNKMPGPTSDFTVKDTQAVWMTSAMNNACGIGMVFAVNAPMGGGKTISDFQALALKNNGMGLRNAALQVENPVPQVASTVSINVGAAGAVASGAVASGGAATAAAPTSQPSVIPGQGTTGAGQECGCSCLCGQGAFPPNAGVGMFGGFLGTMPMGAMSPATMAGVMPPSGAAPTGASGPGY